MNHPSVRDLEVININSLKGRAELRLVLENDFGIDSLVVDWIVHSLEPNDQVTCESCKVKSSNSGNEIWFCQECVSQGFGESTASL